MLVLKSLKTGKKVITTKASFFSGVFLVTWQKIKIIYLFPRLNKLLRFRGNFRYLLSGTKKLLVL